MRRVLVVAYYFPPIGGIGSIRLSRFASHLPEFGWEPIVLTPRDTPHAPDPSLHFPEDRVVRSRSIELSRAGAAFPAGAGGPARGTSGLKDLARGFAHRYLFYPDAQVGWYPGAVLAGRHLLRSERFDAVYSSSFPITAHLVARTLSAGADLPWIAEYRDPWSDGLARDHPHRRRAAALEARIARQATELVMPTRTWASHLGSRWGREVVVIQNGHEAVPAGAAPEDPPVLTHLGSHYHGRQSFQALWSALGRLGANGHPLPHVRFIGELDPAVRDKATAAGVGHLVEATGFVPHSEAARLLASSSMLFASGAVDNDPIARGWIPAKLFEYLASDLPILYLGDPAGDAAQLLRGQPGCFVIPPSDGDGLTAALEAGLDGTRYSRDVDELSRRAGARKLAGLLDRVVA
jgi:glycosyltransferase involved in cell wall biosynthesis